MRTFSRVRGQDAAVQTLDHALRRGCVHHAYRFEGPPGVGKELTAFELAKALLCEADADARPCQTCSTCRRVSTFNETDPRVPLHPDVVLVARGLYPPSMLGKDGGETSAISVQQIRSVVLPRTGYPPHQGRALVIIIRDADEMTPSAANALLKTLEEPHADTHFILVTAKPDRLLPTIRSRTLPVRFGPLPDRVVVEILEKHQAPPELAPLAEGSASQALALASTEQRERREHFADAARRAMAATDLATGMQILEGSASSREVLGEQLALLSVELAREARNLIVTDERTAQRCAHRFFLVQDSLRLLERNAQPTLVLEALVRQLQAVGP